VLIQEHIVLGG